MALEQWTDKAERTEPSWPVEHWEDKRESLFRSTRQADIDRENNMGAAQNKEAWMDNPTDNTAHKETWNEEDTREDEQRNLPRIAWCSAHRLELHGNQSASQHGQRHPKCVTCL